MNRDLLTAMCCLWTRYEVSKPWIVQASDEYKQAQDRYLYDVHWKDELPSHLQVHVGKMEV